MSLFKTKTFWNNHCATDEEFDHTSLKVSKLNGNFDYVLIGSHAGILRIYKPRDGITGESSNFHPNDLMLEKRLASAILQVDVGRLVSGSAQKQIAVLHPRSLVVFNLTTKEGIAEHGTENALNLMYEHKLRRSAANFIIDGFGGSQSRDFACVQTLDGMLNFFEQENFNFCCFLPDFLLPGPIVYVKSSDSFITLGSNWYLQSYRYKTLSEAGRDSKVDGDDKKVTCDWNFNLGENILDMRAVYDDATRQSFTMVLGEKNLYCFTDSGRMKFLKKLEFSPSCFCAYFSDDGKLNALIITETSTLLIYQDVTLKWSAKLHFLPVCVSRAFFREVPGALVMLSEEGYLELGYLGTEPNLFSAPPLKNQELDFEKTENELASLNKIIRSTLNNEIKFANANADKELLLTVSVNPHLEEYLDETIVSTNNAMCCTATIEITPQAIFEEVHVSLHVQKPLVITPQSQLFSNLSDSTRFNCRIYLEDTTDVPSLDLEVVLTSVTNMGIPRANYKKVSLPLKLVVETCQPIKESKHKITLNTNQNPVSLSTLFPEYIGENSLSLTSSAIGFQNIGTNGPIVTLLAAKSSQRYRLQSDSLSSLNIIMQDTIRRLRHHFSATQDFTISFSSVLPTAEAIEYIREHFEYARSINGLQNDLSQLSAQLRLIQKRLIAKFKQKNPTPLSNLDVLLQDTNTQITEATAKLEGAQEKLIKSQNKLSCVLNLLTSLIAIAETEKDLTLVKEALSPFVCDSKNHNWEDIADASLCYLLRTTFAKSEKDKLRAPHTSFDEVKDVSKFEKHFAQLLERISKKVPLLETVGLDDGKEDAQAGDEKENAEENNYLGSEIGSASSRVLSARKSLLRRRHKADE